MKKLCLIMFLFILMVIPTKAWAINEVNVYFFHSETCSICQEEKIYLQALQQRYPNMRIYSYEISDSNNNSLMLQAKSLYNEAGSGVPFTVIGDKAYLGFSQSKKALFQKTVYDYSTNAYQNELGKKLGISYRNDLEGTVEEYKSNDSYQIEETSGNAHTSTSTQSSYDKYKISFYLVGVGITLAIIAFIIRLLEKRDRI